MNKLKMKIHQFDEASQSLIVSFASDQTRSQNPEDYQSFAYQPALQWPGVTDPLEIKKRIAQTGIHLVEQQRLKEEFENNKINLDVYRSMAGHTTEYTLEELTAPVTAPEESTDPTGLVTNSAKLNVIEI